MGTEIRYDNLIFGGFHGFVPKIPVVRRLIGIFFAHEYIKGTELASRSLSFLHSHDVVSTKFGPKFNTKS